MAVFVLGAAVAIGVFTPIENVGTFTAPAKGKGAPYPTDWRPRAPGLPKICPPERADTRPGAPEISTMPAFFLLQ